RPSSLARIIHSRPATAQPGSQDREFDWRWLTLADLHGCVAGLRAIGCPEATIQDVLVAEVNRRFAPRERALSFRYEDYEPWETPPPGTRNVLERQLQLRAL